MSEYKIIITPAEPFFFGNEKSFRYPGQKIGGKYSNSYFIKSEEVPSQSTILGALRYILIPHKNYPNDENKRKENEAAVGKLSFNIELSSKDGFGKIKSVSPVFIVRGEKNYIPVPFNHNKSAKGKTYKPFEKFGRVETPDGKKLYAKDFDVKEGITSDYVEVSETAEIIKKDDIFASSVRVGINKSLPKKGFFKKEYKMLNRGYSFAVFADIDEEIIETETVCLGQGKSPFAFRFIKTYDTAYVDFKKSIAKLLYRFESNKNLIYCFGDAFPNGNPCDGTLFTVLDTKDFRSFCTNTGGKIKKGGTLYRLVKAGSIFITEDGKAKEWTEKNKNEYANKIGYNQFITAEELNNEI